MTFMTFPLVRTLQIDGEPWFVAADVCRALEVGNARDAVGRLDDDEKTKANLAIGLIEGGNINGLGGVGNAETWVVSESGLYALILSSRKPSAKRFKKWVVGEVLPAIPETGVKVELRIGDRQPTAPPRRRSYASVCVWDRCAGL